MKQITSTQKDYSILRKVQQLHTHTLQRDSTFTLGRTTSYESSQFCKSFDIMAFRRASTKEEIQQPNLAISNLSSIRYQLTDNRSPCHHMEMDPLQMRVWKTLTKQSLQPIYVVDVIVLRAQSENEFKFDLAGLSCFLTVSELTAQIYGSFKETFNSELKNPYLSILIGRVKTQKIDKSMRLFELVNILLNSQKTLILQENQ